MSMVSSRRKGDQIAQNGDDFWKILNLCNSSFEGQTPSTLHSSCSLDQRDSQKSHRSNPIYIAFFMSYRYPSGDNWLWPKESIMDHTDLCCSFPWIRKMQFPLAIRRCAHRICSWRHGGSWTSAHSRTD